MHEQETPTPDLTAQDAGLPDDLDPAMTDVHRTRAQGRRDLAYLLGAMALVNSVNDGPRERQPSADPTAFDHFAPNPYVRVPGLGPAQTPPMTPEEREERKQARRASAPKRAQRQARKAQRRRK